MDHMKSIKKEMVIKSRNSRKAPWFSIYKGNLSFPEVGQKQKTEKKKKEEEEERLNDGETNGQATHGARKHAWRTQAAWANNLITQ